MSRPDVLLVDGDEASGFASMLAEVLDGNVSDFRGRAFVAAHARGAVVLRASDRDAAVTLRFGPEGVSIADGAQDGAPQLSGPWLTMAGLCSGSVSPARALKARELHIKPTARLDTVAAAGFALSVPASYYGETDHRREVAIALAAGGVVVVGALWWARRRRRS